MSDMNTNTDTLNSANTNTTTAGNSPVVVEKKSGWLKYVLWGAVGGAAVLGGFFLVKNMRVTAAVETTTV